MSAQVDSSVHWTLTKLLVVWVGISHIPEPLRHVFTSALGLLCFHCGHKSLFTRSQTFPSLSHTSRDPQLARPCATLHHSQPEKANSSALSPRRHLPPPSPLTPPSASARCQQRRSADLGSRRALMLSTVWWCQVWSHLFSFFLWTKINATKRTHLIKSLEAASKKRRKKSSHMMLLN